MTWDDHRRRNAALDAVLLFARSYPDADLPLSQMPGLVTLFGDRRGLVLALQARWSQRLWARTQALSLTAPRPTGKDTVLYGAQAWRDCASANPTLRRLLDRHLPEFGDAAQERVYA